MPRRDIGRIFGLDRNGRNVEIKRAGSNGRFWPAVDGLAVFPVSTRLRQKVRSIAAVQNPVSGRTPPSSPVAAGAKFADNTCCNCWESTGFVKCAAHPAVSARARSSG